MSTNLGDSLFLLVSMINPAALNNRSTAVEVAGGVRYLVEKDWVKGKDNSSHSPFSQSHKSFACRTFGKEACLILLPPPVNWENLAYTKKSEQSLYLRQAVTMSSYGV